MNMPPKTRRSRKPLVVAAAVLGGWLLLAVAAAPFATKLSSLQKNDLADFLPSSAEATQVLKLEAGFENAKVVPAVIVFERSAGITAEDRASVTAEIGGLQGLKGIVGQPS